MIHSVTEGTSTVLSFVQSSRDRGAAKSIAEESHVQDQKIPSDIASSKDHHRTLSSKSLDEVVAEAQETLRQIEPRVQLSVDDELNRVIVKVVDSDSGELIRQIPPEEVLRIQRFFSEQFGILVEEEA